MIAGRYELEREIGRGGAGVVWLAQDHLLHRQVALKQIGRAPGASDVDAQRADREARLSASIQHPNIVAVFDHAIDEATGDQWLVMEYVDGASLGQLIRDRGPMPRDRAARIMEQVAHALAASHAAGLTHRDVKPSNILLKPDGTAKLTDFGIARTLNDPQLTQTGLLSGSPAYLAPEVASGQRGDMTADVWSWGATLFHLLAGRPPYDVGDNVMGALYRIVHDDPPRLADAGPLAPVLEGTMSKDPSARWPMTRVCDELAGIDWDSSDGRTLVMPTTVPPPPAPPPDALTRPLAAPQPATTPWGRRRPVVPVALVGAGVLALLLVLALAGAFSGGGGSGDGGGGDGDSGAAARSHGSTSSAAPVGPTVAGMRAFIRDYVRTVADDPAAAWPMLTARFQDESGGFPRYRAFWEPATDGTVTDIQADPTTMRVSYRPHFDHWHNSDNPTVLDLVFRDGRYLIDAEHTVGFTPAPTAGEHEKPEAKDHPAKHGKGKGPKKKP